MLIEMIDAFVPSQLIMISGDCLAQYWVNLGEVMRGAFGGEGS
jgi:hypothetical protein